jgi:hypothetical protein
MPSAKFTLPFAVALAIIGASRTQAQGVPPDTVIRLQRTECLGECPIYTVTIDARGTVTYEGEKFVRVIGRRTVHVDPSAVATLLKRAEQIRFFDLRDVYRVIQNADGSMMTMTDGPTTFVTITANGRSKRVEDYLDAPASLVQFEREIDSVAGTKRWLFVDADALEELVRSGWLATSEDGAKLLQQAIERDDLPIARRLIELGSDLHGPSTGRTVPLIPARSSAMVDLLVKAGADPNERPVGAVGAPTPLMMAWYKDPAVAEALLNSGARVDDTDGGLTALAHAACNARWRIVEVLLRAGADPRGSGETSAAGCARRGRQNEVGRRRTALDRGGPTVEDFDRVLAMLEAAEKRMKR